MLLHPHAIAMEFKKGPLIKNYGPHAAVEQDYSFAKDSKFKVAFDVTEPGDVNVLNRKFVSLARFLNMHVANGIPAENLNLALVVHSKALQGLLNDNAFSQRFEGQNPNKELIQELLKNNVDIYVCGQSAAFYKVKNSDLLPGVKMALSAMTVHALLQQQGYTSNPF